MYILFQIADKAKYLLEVMGSGQSPGQIVSELMNSNAALKITGRIHLFTLLFEVRNTNLYVLIIDMLMSHAESFMFNI
jgi:hypothetical protein